MFSTLELDLVAGDGTPDGSVALAGLPQPLARGLYSLSFRTQAPDGTYPVKLRYETADTRKRTGTAHLELKVARGRAHGRFVMPEPGDALRLEGLVGKIAQGSSKAKLRRLSSRLVHAEKLARTGLQWASEPSHLRRRASQALAILQRQGPAGLLQAMRRRADARHHQQDFAQRYARWAEHQDADLAAHRKSLAAKATALPAQTLISVIMPVFDPPVDALREAIDSVRNQIWPHWELCIVDDASSDPQIRALIEQMASEEPRISPVLRKERGHISAASNDALAMAGGEWVAFLDHDDRLSLDALLEVATVITANADAGLIYSDEDKLDGNGKRCLPAFKPDWDPELFLSYNVINHLACYRTALVREVGGLREGYEGAQDYDLALRVSERLKPEAIVHIPRILYHWRMAPDSVASGTGAKPYAMEAGRRALADHFRRTGVEASVHFEETFYRVDYPLPAKPPKVSIVIPTRDRLSLLATCVASIREKTDYPDYEIIIVDNGSMKRATLDWLARNEAEGSIRVLREGGPFNFSAHNNAGVAAAAGEIVVLLNNDIEIVTPDWLRELASLCLRPGVGAVGARLLYPDGTLQHGGVVLDPEVVARHWFRGVAGDHSGPGQRLKVRQALSAVTGACLATTKQLYLELGGLDADNLQVAFNDIDYCLKVSAAGLRVVFTPFAELIHHESASRGKDMTPEKSRRLYAEMAFMKDKWDAALAFDRMAMPGFPSELGKPGLID